MQITCTVVEISMNGKRSTCTPTPNHKSIPTDNENSWEKFVVWSWYAGVTLFLQKYNIHFLVVSDCIFSRLQFSCNLTENCLAAYLAVI